MSRLFIIFPFEVPIYEKEKVTFTYTGHPLLAEVRVGEPRADFRRRHGVEDGDILLALLPGSREAEVRTLLPEIMGAVRRLRREFPLKVFLQRAQNIHPRQLAAVASDPDIRIVDQEQGFDLLNAADAVITTCGTSNLEAALLGVPFVAIYRINRLTYLLGRRFVKDRPLFHRQYPGRQAGRGRADPGGMPGAAHRRGDPEAAGRRAAAGGDAPGVPAHQGEPAAGRTARRHHLPPDEGRAGSQ